jgi:hypothetical protein
MIGREQVDLRRALEGGKDSAVGRIPLDPDKVALQVAARHVRNLLLLAGGRIDVPDLIEDEERDVKPVLAVRGDALRHPRRIAHVVECDDSPSSTTRYVSATTRWPRSELVVLPAPVGHRHPTLDDLPPWLREMEKLGTQASPTQDPGQRRSPPDDGVPRICEPC